jgi:SulP family sulfate permease
MMLSTYLPCLQWLKGYNTQSFRGDLVSGLTIGFMLIPQGMAYAIVAGLPPEYGLYASIFPPLMYALLGTSNKVSTGPVALDAILIITGLSVIATPGSEHYLELAIGLALMVGVFQLIFGLARFGFLVNFLSHPVISGYTSAAAVIIIVSQFEGLLGCHIAGSNPFATVTGLLASFDVWHPLTCVVGLVSMAFIFATKKFAPRAPYAILLVVIGMLLSGWLNLRGHGVVVVDTIPTGLPPLSMPSLGLDEWQALLPTAFTVSLMGYIGTISIAKSVETAQDKIVANPNGELIALGAANILGAFCKAFPVSASFSRSAVFRESGARTQLSAVISSLLLVLVLLYLAPLFEQFPLPKALLSAMIIMSVFKLVQYRQFIQLLAQSRREALVMLVTFLLTLTLGVQLGLIIGVITAMLMVIYNSSQPHMTELGLLADDKLYRNVSRFDSAIIRKEVLIFRFDALLYFANANFFKQQLHQWVNKRDPEQLHFVVFNAESVSSIDSTATLMLIQLIENLKSQNVRFYVSNAIGPVRDQIRTSSLAVCLPTTHVFATVEDAIHFIDEGIHYRAQIAMQSNH